MLEQSRYSSVNEVEVRLGELLETPIPFLVVLLVSAMTLRAIANAQQPDMTANQISVLRLVTVYCVDFHGRVVQEQKANH